MLKKLFVFFIFLLCCCNLFAQSSNLPEPSQSPTAPYRLFRTQNMWTFIELDTITGKMWQVHFDVEGNNRGVVRLNTEDLASGRNKIPERFTLYPTSNIYTFILHDEIEGRSWQVQWSWEEENRLVIPIG